MHAKKDNATMGVIKRIDFKLNLRLKFIKLSDCHTTQGHSNVRDIRAK